MFILRTNSKCILQRGSLLVEIAIATSIFVVIGVAVFSVAQRSLSLSNQSMVQTQAAYLIEEGFEAIKLIRDADSDSIFSLIDGTERDIDYVNDVWQLVSDPIDANGMRRIITFNKVSRGPNDDIEDPSSPPYDEGAARVTIDIYLGASASASALVGSASSYIFDIF